MLAEALKTGKENTYLEYVVIPVGMTQYSFQEGRVLMQSTRSCQLVHLLVGDSMSVSAADSSDIQQ